VDLTVVWAAAATERRALADQLDRLTPAQWASPSLCAGWDVRTVTAHLVTALSPALLSFLVALARARGDLHRANDAVARRAATRPASDLVAELRRRAGSRTAPPVTGPRAPLTDVLVHAGDIRLPLGLPHEPAADGVRAALDFVTTGRPVGFVPRGRLAGLRLVAEDLDRSWGEGEEVGGRGIDLLMAACGRAAALERLHGPGADLLSGRLAARPPLAEGSR
jgi:uncharacterized protein (TIGR03083 family)